MLVCLAKHCINSYRIDREKVVHFLDSDTKLFILYLNTGRKSVFDIILQSIYLLWITIWNTSLKLSVTSFWGNLSRFLRLLFFCSSVGAWQCCDMPAGPRAVHSKVSAAIVPQHQDKLGIAHWYPGGRISTFIYFTAIASLRVRQSCDLFSIVYYPSCISNSSQSLVQWLSLGAVPHGFVEQDWCSGIRCSQVH